MNMMFDLFDLIFPVMFLLIFGMILFTFISGIRTWNKNNNSPRLTVEARVTAKRQNTTHHNEPIGGDTSGTHGYHTTTSTSYYVTFEVESGDRMEFSVYGEEYGMLAEGDEGKLTFQGIRRYWKVRRVAEQRQFIQRRDIRLKVQIPVSYMQDTWALNTEGKIEKESGETIDISNNGMAVYMNHWFDVGESCIFTLPRLGNAGEGEEELEVAGVICWMRELPKGGAFRFATGVQLHFGSVEEGRKMQEYVAYVKKRYRL